MNDPLREPGFLTEHQFATVEADGNFFLSACPGSGKTRTGAVRLARLVMDGRTVAATSYTNIGVDQIRQVVSGTLGVAIPPSCFVGTLHGFFLRFVFYPFGHLSMRCNSRPRVIPDDSSWWDDVVFGNHRIRAPVADFRFRPDGSLRFPGQLPHGVPTEARALALGSDQALRLKRRAAAAGIASPDDSMFWALRVLREHPELARAVAHRFAELQVDEAQDTSELQLACVQELSATGELASLVLIGDVEQSIFSFQGASPEGCEALALARGLERRELSENHRSSQRLCDVTFRFSSRTEPDRAVGEDAECNWAPELLIYEPGHASGAVDQFRRRLAALGVPEDEAAVLVRERKLADEINGEAPVKIGPRVRAIGRAAAIVFSGGTLTRGDVDRLQSVLAYLAWGTKDLTDLDDPERRSLRDASVALVGRLPRLSGDLASWTRGASDVVGVAARTLQDPLAHNPGQGLRSGAGHNRVEAASAFAPPPRTLRAQTVHAVKGEGRDAVLVVADRQRSTRREPQSAVWSTLLMGKGVAPEDVEELRIAFVALTRARRYCAVAMPSDTPAPILAAFQDAGFVPVGPVGGSKPTT